MTKARSWLLMDSSVYWMAGLAPDAAHFFKFLFILVLFAFAMTLFVRYNSILSPAWILAHSRHIILSTELPARLYLPQRRYCHPLIRSLQSLYHEWVKRLVSHYSRWLNYFLAFAGFCKLVTRQSWIGFLTFHSRTSRRYPSCPTLAPMVQRAEVLPRGSRRQRGRFWPSNCRFSSRGSR